MKNQKNNKNQKLRVNLKRLQLIKVNLQQIKKAILNLKKHQQKKLLRILKSLKQSKIQLMML
jgi:hypothetical protein